MYSCVVVFTCNSNMQKVDTGLQIQGLSQVHSKSHRLKARLYETLSQKINIIFFSISHVIEARSILPSFRPSILSSHVTFPLPSSPRSDARCDGKNLWHQHSG